MQYGQSSLPSATLVLPESRQVSSKDGEAAARWVHENKHHRLTRSSRIPLVGGARLPYLTPRAAEDCSKQRLLLPSSRVDRLPVAVRQVQKQRVKQHDTLFRKTPPLPENHEGRNEGISCQWGPSPSNKSCSRRPLQSTLMPMLVTAEYKEEQHTV